MSIANFSSMVQSVYNNQTKYVLSPTESKINLTANELILKGIQDNLLNFDDMNAKIGSLNNVVFSRLEGGSGKQMENRIFPTHPEMC